MDDRHSPPSLHMISSGKSPSPCSPRPDLPPKPSPKPNRPSPRHKEKSDKRGIVTVPWQLHCCDYFAVDTDSTSVISVPKTEISAVNLMPVSQNISETTSSITNISFGGTAKPPSSPSKPSVPPKPHLPRRPLTKKPPPLLLLKKESKDPKPAKLLKSSGEPLKNEPPSAKPWTKEKLEDGSPELSEKILAKSSEGKEEPIASTPVTPWTTKAPKDKPFPFKPWMKKSMDKPLKETDTSPLWMKKTLKKVKDEYPPHNKQSEVIEDMPVNAPTLSKATSKRSAEDECPVANPWTKKSMRRRSLKSDHEPPKQSWLKKSLRKASIDKEEALLHVNIKPPARPLQGKTKPPITAKPKFPPKERDEQPLPLWVKKAIGIFSEEVKDPPIKPKSKKPPTPDKPWIKKTPQTHSEVKLLPTQRFSKDEPPKPSWRKKSIKKSAEEKEKTRIKKMIPESQDRPPIASKPRMKKPIGQPTEDDSSPVKPWPKQFIETPSDTTQPSWVKKHLRKYSEEKDEPSPPVKIRMKKEFPKLPEEIDTPGSSTAVKPWMKRTTAKDDRHPVKPWTKQRIENPSEVSTQPSWVKKEYSKEKDELTPIKPKVKKLFVRPSTTSTPAKQWIKKPPPPAPNEKPGIVQSTERNKVYSL